MPQAHSCDQVLSFIQQQLAPYGVKQLMMRDLQHNLLLLLQSVVRIIRAIAR